MSIIQKIFYNNKSIKKILIVILSIITYSLSYSNFNFSLQRKEKLCFHEYYSDQTLLIISVNSLSDSNLNVFVRDPDQKKDKEQHNIKSYKESFTTYKGGNYEVCIINTERKDVEVMLEIKSGIAAKDYSTVAKMQDLQPIEKDLLLLEDSSKELRHLISFFNTHQKNYDGIQNSVVMNISYFSIFVIVIMLSLGLIETLISRHIVISNKLK